MTEKIIFVPAGFYSDELRLILEFASTFNGYEAYGEDLAPMANEIMHRWHKSKILPEDLNSIRACLFFEGRRGRFVGGYPDESDMPYLRALMLEIQEKLMEFSN